MNFSNGVLTLTFDETIDVTPARSRVNLSALHVTTRQINDGWLNNAQGFEYHPQTNTTVGFSQTLVATVVGGVGTSSDVVLEEDAVQMHIQLPEAKRVALFKQSRLYLVNESQVPLDHNLEAGDLNPYFNQTVVCNPSNHVSMRVDCFTPSAWVPSPTHYLFFHMDTGGTGGTGGLGVDIAGNTIAYPAHTRTLLEEIVDDTRPKVVSSVLHLSTGVLSLVLSETIDATPASYVDLTRFRVLNNTVLSYDLLDHADHHHDHLTLEGGQVSSLTDSVIVNITATWR
jgi:hypothetical protein